MGIYEVHQKAKNGVMPEFPQQPGLEKMSSLYSRKEDGNRIITEGGSKTYPRIRVIRDAETYKIIQRDYWMSMPRKHRGSKVGIIFQYNDGLQKDRYDFLSASGNNFQILCRVIKRKKAMIVGVVCGISKKFSKEISDFLDDNWNIKKEHKEGPDINLSEFIAYTVKKKN